MLIIVLKVIVILCTADVIGCYSFNHLNKDYYIAGAIEYMPQIAPVSPQSNIANNLKAYLNLIDLAKKKNVDILVFPEATLNYYGLGGRKTLLENALDVPDPAKKIAPCNHIGDYSEVLTSISKSAKDNRIYVLINIVEKVPCSINLESCKLPYNTHHDNYSLYNTNIVFDRYGRIISKYRKVNLYIEPQMDEPLKQPLPTFQTDFNVKFGHFICFDILFKDPAMSIIRQENVTNILYPSMWFSEMPFLTAEQTHQGWAYANDVKLISAGASNPHIGSTGTGIYLGRKGIPDIVMTSKPIQKLYTAKIPKDDSVQSNPIHRDESSAFEMLKLRVTENWANHDVTVFDIGTGPQMICASKDICCTFEIKKKDNPIPPGKLAYRYALHVNYTTHLYALNRLIGELDCTVISCIGTSPGTCGRRFKSDNIFPATEFEEIKIKAKVRSNTFEDIVVMPNTLTGGIFPFDTSAYMFNSSEIYKNTKYHYKDFMITSRGKLPEFLTFGMYGRDFQLDKILPISIPDIGWP